MSQEREFFNNYAEFIDGVTSDESRSFGAFMHRLQQLHDAGLPIERLLTAGVGMAAEAGEFDEIVKKIVFQGKEWNEDNRHHMKLELGDTMWYWMQACIALDYNPVDIIVENIHKLEARYPGGKFDVFKSEVRKEGDI